ncbi:MAG: ABC transporter permease [ANME-2 cluster archaeon]|nr:ABC transporter permease [ANME-2 cluster archaeon]
MSSAEFIIQGIITAIELIAGMDPYILSIAGVSLKVSGTATFIASLTAIPLSFIISHREFWGKQKLLTLINTGMGLPSVFVGLFVFIMLVPAGPLGFLKLIFTPKAMIIAQYILVTPIITSISLAAINAVPIAIRENAYSLGGSHRDVAVVVLKEAKFGIVTSVLAGFGRAIAEVGAILIVGGNIAYTGSVGGIGEGLSYTRTLTTAITSETSSGDISVAIALGLILITINLSVNAAVSMLQGRGEERGTA